MKSDSLANGNEHEYGRTLFAQSCKFVAGITSRSQFFPSKLPEVAFFGRSNVGKSSLINALTGRRALARVSKTPGRTQQINLFDLGDRLTLVDLPGYGYARAPRVRTHAWNQLVAAYVDGRTSLRRLYLLIDSRHGVKPNDEEIMGQLDRAAVSFQIVLTKCDKVAEPTAIASSVSGTIAKHACAHPQVMTTSGVTGLGIPELRTTIATLAAPKHFG